MRKLILLIILLVSICFLSCSKEDEEQPILQISSIENIVFSPFADEKVTVLVETNQSDWDVHSSEKWCIISKTNNSFVVSANKYDGESARVSIITISAKGVEPILLYAYQTPVALTIDEDLKQSIGEDGGLVTFNIHCNTQWTLSTKTSWLIADKTSGVKDGTASISVLPNEKEIADEGIVEIQAGTSILHIIISRAAKSKIYNIGDLYPDDENPVGMVFSTSDGGRHGKVFYLKMEWRDCYSKENYRIGATADGQTNMERVKLRIKEGKLAWGAYPAFNICRSVAGDGWYVPDWSELAELYAFYNGGKSPVNKEARESCNKKIIAAGGKELNEYSSYLSSNEYNISSYVYVSFTEGVSETKTAPKNVTMSVRPVMSF